MRRSLAGNRLDPLGGWVPGLRPLVGEHSHVSDGGVDQAEPLGLDRRHQLAVQCVVQQTVVAVGKRHIQILCFHGMAQERQRVSGHANEAHLAIFF